MSADACFMSRPEHEVLTLSQNVFPLLVCFKVGIFPVLSPFFTTLAHSLIVAIVIVSFFVTLALKLSVPCRRGEART